MQREPTTIGHLGLVNAGVTVGLDQIVRRRGGDPARVLEESGLRQAFDELHLTAQNPEITLSAFSCMLRSAAKETKLPTLSMEFAQDFDVRSLGAIGYLFDLAPDLGTALKDFCSAFELVQENTAIGVEAHGELARISYSVRVGTPEEKAPDAEFSVTMLGAALRRGLNASVDVHRVDLEHIPGWEREAAPAWLGKDFRLREHCNAIYVRRDALDRPGPSKDPYLYRIVADRVRDELKSLGSRNDTVNVVLRSLGEAFYAGKLAQISASNVADQLGISARTLHRQLAAYGTGFRDLRNASLLDSARLLLSDPQNSVTEIALALGFSETSAFSRAFRDLTGESPAEFRKS